MNDEHDSVDSRHSGEPDEAPVDPDQARVSSLLAAAGAGAGERTPPEVAARLDDVLAGLVSERTASDPTAAAGAVRPEDVVGAADLESRRRRRWPTLLVAAAAVSVLGLGLGNVMDDLTGTHSDSVTAESAGGDAVGGLDDVGAAAGTDSAESAPAPTAQEPEEAGEGVGTSEELSTASPRALRADGATAPPPLLRADSLLVDLERAEVFSLAVPIDEDSPDLREQCVRPAMTEGDEWLRVRLDGDTAVLVLRAPREGRRTAEVFTCDDGDTPAASVRIDAR